MYRIVEETFVKEVYVEFNAAVKLRDLRGDIVQHSTENLVTCAFCQTKVVSSVITDER